jgi:hypothetical protein
LPAHLRELSQKSDLERPYEAPKYWAAFICLGNSAWSSAFTILIGEQGTKSEMRKLQFQDIPLFLD